MFLVFCFGHYVACDAQNPHQAHHQFSFNDLTVDDGLSQNSVVGIAQDSTGYLWLATLNGLNRYSGKDFVYYEKQFGYTAHPMFSKPGGIYVDRQNRLWIIVAGKLELYLPKTGNFLAVPSFSDVTKIHQANNSDLYIGTYGEGIYKIDSKTKDTLKLPAPEETPITILDFHEFDNKMWMACNEGVYTYDPLSNSFAEIPIKDSVVQSHSALEHTRDSTIWLGTSNKGLFYKSLENNEFLPFEHKDLPENLIVSSLLVDSKDQLWIGTYGNGAYLYDPVTKRVSNFKKKKRVPFTVQYNDLPFLYEDGTEVIWMGSDGMGAYYYDPYLFKFNVLTNAQLPNDVDVGMARSITSDAQGNIWIGTSGNGLTRVNTKAEKYITYTSTNSPLSSDRVVSLLHNGKDLWIGYAGSGLSIVEPSGKYLSFSEIQTLSIYAIVKKSSTQSWLCTEHHGLILFDKHKGVIEQFNTQNSKLTTNNIRIIEKENDSIWWVGTEEKGLFKVSLSTKRISPIIPIPDKIKSLHFDDGILWIGTNGNGLKRYDTTSGETLHFSTEQGLSDNVVYGILADDKDNLWLSSNKGIAKFNTKDFNITNYNDQVYLQFNEFNTGAYHKDNKGTLYFGGIKGINWFDPDQIKTNPYKPKTVITDVKVFNDTRSLSEEIPLKHTQNTITFTFASLQFSQPKLNQYKYRLIGNDADWISSGNNNVAHYTNLPPNDYTFEVISSNYDGVWNMDPVRYPFTILKPWYITTMAKVTYALLFLLLCYLLYYYLKWRWNVQNQLRLEQEETERLKQLDEHRTNLYTNISHEFRTPLTLISGPIEHQLGRTGLSKEDRKELSLIKESTHRLLSLVNQMLDLSMIDSGHLRLKVEKGGLRGLLVQLVEAFAYIAKEKDINLAYGFGKMDNAWFDRDVVEKIVSNLLSNAVKYAPRGSEILINAEKEQDSLVLSTVNSTDGMEIEDLGKLFKRFHQNNENSEGVGVGLALVRELVSLSRGSIIAHNIGENKIQFTLTLPITRRAYGLNDSEGEQSQESKSLEMEPILGGNTKKPSLLLVEDDKDILAYLVSIFKNDYNIVKAANGKEGMEMALKKLPDLIISDIMMPLLSGIELCKKIKIDELSSHIPVVLLTAKAGEESQLKGLETGADAYVTKPFSPNILKVRVEKLLENRTRLQRHYSKTFKIDPGLVPTKTETKFLERLQQVLDSNITSPEFTSEEFSRHMHMSRSQLHKKLHAVTGMSTTQFVRTQRINLAKGLLAESDVSISEIAYQVGFNTPSYFNKCFKEIEGCTPNEYLSKQS